jgi:hypothetical protein
MAQDIRWQQRFSNYRNALERLEDFLEASRTEMNASSRA